MNGGAQTQLRFLRAYWVTLVVVWSYSWTRFVGSLRGDQWFQAALREKHVLNARRIQRAIVRLQGLFIKVGQTFSILTNFLPPEFRAELEGLQDSVPPRPFTAIRERFREDFGKAPLEVFAEFDETPLAAASISQVHLARTHAGERVAVKVQYPDVDRMVRSDLKTFARILKIIGLFFPAQGLGLVHREVSQMLLAELDFEAEATSMEIIGRNLATAGFPGIGVPTVYRELSTRRVLTTGFVPGVNIANVARLDDLGIDRGELARRLVEVYCRQIFVDGIYHADPHPGNILVDDDGSMTLLDFGAVATVGPSMRRGIAHFLQAVLNQNTEKIAQALREMGFIANTGLDGEGEEVFDRVVGYFHEKFQQSITLESFNLSDIKVDPEMGLEHLLALRQMDIGIGELSSAFQIPREWILLERTLLLLTGLCTHLDASARPMELVRPYLREFLLGEDGDWSTFALDTGKELLLQYFGLPAELRKFLARASTGRIEVRVRRLDSGLRRLYALGHQMIYTAIGITAVCIAASMHLHGELEVRNTALWVAGGATLFLLGSMFGARRR